MKKVMVLFLSVLFFSQSAVYASDVSNRKPSTSEKSCTGNADNAALPTSFNYSISADGNSMTLSNFVSEFQGVDFKECAVAARARSAFHFRETGCNLLILSINSQGVSINNTDGNFAYYKCH